MNSDAAVLLLATAPHGSISPIIKELEKFRDIDRSNQDVVLGYKNGDAEQSGTFLYDGRGHHYILRPGKEQTGKFADDFRPAGIKNGVWIRTRKEEEGDLKTIGLVE